MDSSVGLWLGVTLRFGFSSQDSLAGPVFGVKWIYSDNCDVHTMIYIHFRNTGPCATDCITELSRGEIVRNH